MIVNYLYEKTCMDSLQQIKVYIPVKALLQVLYNKIHQGSSGKYSMRQTGVLYLPGNPTLGTVFYRTAQVCSVTTDLLVLCGRFTRKIFSAWSRFDKQSRYDVLGLLLSAPLSLFIR